MIPEVRNLHIPTESSTVKLVKIGFNGFSEVGGANPTLDVALVDDVLDYINTSFAESKVQFVLNAVEIIENPSLMSGNIGSSSFVDEFDIFDSNWDQLNVFVTQSTNTYGGVARRPSSLNFSPVNRYFYLMDADHFGSVKFFL